MFWVRGGGFRAARPGRPEAKGLQVEVAEAEVGKPEFDLAVLSAGFQGDGPSGQGFADEDLVAVVADVSGVVDAPGLGAAVVEVVGRA